MLWGENNLIEIYMDDELLQSLRKKETIKELQSKFYRKAYDIGEAIEYKTTTIFI